MRHLASVLLITALAGGCGDGASSTEPLDHDRMGSLPDPTTAGLAVRVQYIRADRPGDWRTARISAVRTRVGRELIFALGHHRGWHYDNADPADWESSDPSVVTIELGSVLADVPRVPAVIVRAVGTGRATVTATVGRRSASVDIRVDPAGGVVVAERSVLDREDDLHGTQVHFVYAVLDGGRDDGHDINGFFPLLAEEIQEWLDDQAGLKLRLDTHEGDLDVSFLSIDGDEIPSYGQLHDALEAREGGMNPDKKYVLLLDYDGANGALPFTGQASGQLAVTLINPHYQQVAGVTLHELIHTFGAVPDCAPNHDGRAHVLDHDRDIMSDGNLVGGVLDWNNDDYFRHGRSDCLDTADSPYWEP